MGKSQRDKGARFEREVATLLRFLDPEAKRNITECQGFGKDVTTSLPVSIQCKNLKRWSTTPNEIYDQAERAAKVNDIPVGMVRITNAKKDLAILSLEDFLRLLELYVKSLTPSP